MTLNILEPDKQINVVETSAAVSVRLLDTESKRIEFLQDMIDLMKQRSGEFKGPPGFIDILSQSLCDKLPSSRCLALDLLSSAIPGFGGGNQLDILFPQLLQNLLNHNVSVKKATLQVLHMYFKHSQDKSVILDYLIKYGIKSDKRILRNEVFLTMPALIHSGFTQKQLEDIFISMLSVSQSNENKESSLPLILCLEHIKDEMGDENFERYFSSLDESLRMLYCKIVKHFSFCDSTKSDSRTTDVRQLLLSKESCNDSNYATDNEDFLVFGFVPKRIISRLDNGVSWQERSDVINEFLAVVSTQMDDNSLRKHCGDLLKYLCTLIEDHNFNVALTSLTILHKVIVKVGPSIRYHLELILKTLVKKLNDPKLVVKKLNLRISLSLMHCISPTSYIQNILPLLKHKNARIREEIINMIIAALLSFPSSYFHLIDMPSEISFTLLDPKRRVRHASLECFAVLSQKLGPGKLSCLVSAVNEIENKNGGAGVLGAVQTRIGRRILPRINEEGFVQYALTIPSGVQHPDNVPLDVAWVIAGTSIGSDSSKKIQEFSDTPGKRHLSAGKKKLPWQNTDDFNVEIPERKGMGSAPGRQGASVAEISNHVTVPVVHDTWVNGSLHTNPANKFSKNALVGHLKGERESPVSQTDISYFEIYKTKMRELKAAGLQADAEMINSINQSINPRNSLDSKTSRSFSKDASNKKDVAMNSSRSDMSDRSTNHHDILSPLSADCFGGVSPNGSERVSPTVTEREHSQYSPVPIKPALARSASKRRLKVHLDEKKDHPPHQQNHHDEVATSNVQTEKQSQRKIIIEGQSPFPSRPTIHRTPSGRLNNKFILQANSNEGDSSNLMNMAAYSFSSPNLDLSSCSGDDSSADLGNSRTIRNIKTPPGRIKDGCSDNVIITSSINDKDRAARSSFNGHYRGYDHPDAPKLAKSAQEKLRKLKEERLRHSIDTTASLKKLKENRLSRSLDFNNVGLLEFKNNCVNNDYDISKDKERKDVSLDEIKRSTHMEKKRGKLKHEKRYKHKEGAPHNSFNSLPSNTPMKSNMELDSSKNSDEPSQMDLSFRSSASSEISLSPSSTPSVDSFLEVKGISTKDENAKIEGETSESNRKKPPKRSDRKKKSSPSNKELKGEETRRKKSGGSTYPLAASSPMCRRKKIPSVDHNNNVEVTANVPNELNTELTNPMESLSLAMELLQSEDWESKCDGLCTIRRLALYHPEYLSQDFHIIVEAVLIEVKNLRSQVTRAALGCIGELFGCVPKLAESELEVILKSVLSKASDTNQFIRFDVDEALKKMVENIHSPKAISAIISTGASHRNALVRKVCAKYVADLAEKMGSSKLLGSYKGIVGVAAKLSVDPQPDARYHGRRILFLLIDEVDLDKQLAKEVPSANLRPVQDIIENLRNKGLGHPPTESASMRWSSRNGIMPSSSRSDVSKGSAQNQAKDNDLENSSATKKDFDNETHEKPKRRTSSKDSSSLQILNAECLKRLESSSWSERYEGLDQFYDLVCTKPSDVSANIIKVFDKFCPRLSDSNSKVNLHALQTLNRCIPILKNGMSATCTVIIDNLKTSLASRNEAIYLAAKDSLVSLTKYVDNTHLLQPLIAAVQYANIRNKAELAESLADIILPVYSKKPGLVVRTVLPLLWNSLSSTNSGVSTPGRGNFQHELGRICKILYQCLGKELLTEAATKGSRASQKLEIMLQ